MKRLIPKIALSLTFLTFSYLLSLINYNLLEELADFYKLGFLTTLERGSLDNFQIIPVYFIWIILGVFAYLLYYSLSLIYYEVYNSVIVKVAYKKPDLKDEIPKIKIFRRIFIHSLVITFSLATALSLFAVMPLSNLLRQLSNFQIQNFFNPAFSFYLSFIPSFILWFLTLNLLLFIVNKLKNTLLSEKIKEEHSAA